MANTRCPGCPSGVKGPGKYLCLTCWHALTPASRHALRRRGPGAMARLQDLYRQVANGVPLADIEVTP
ncbi:hypothetical protein PV396_24580 [Streptomyces sp. ME02-8801-2C]|uniref:hypothetical protein n=1 Tax=Streptomyces sp. ME02-8801-2C TaxID=3028680 RepID=UPI0029A6C054|nr:hypothetical protein [Streptomyces sp. ME02-8801-2C]MDX3455079.1 hypothetical protein [Streptomyces sp. ME02-8801-2C]